jgi:hypothetical protein
MSTRRQHHDDTPPTPPDPSARPACAAEAPDWTFELDRQASPLHVSELDGALADLLLDLAPGPAPAEGGGR